MPVRELLARRRETQRTHAPLDGCLLKQAHQLLGQPLAAVLRSNLRRPKVQRVSEPLCASASIESCTRRDCRDMAVPVLALALSLAHDWRWAASERAHVRSAGGAHRSLDRLRLGLPQSRNTPASAPGTAGRTGGRTAGTPAAQHRARAHTRATSRTVSVSGSRFTLLKRNRSSHTKRRIVVIHAAAEPAVEAGEQDVRAGSAQADGSDRSQGDKRERSARHPAFTSARPACLRASRLPETCQPRKRESRASASSGVEPPACRTTLCARRPLCAVSHRGGWSLQPSRRSAPLLAGQVWRERRSGAPPRCSCRLTCTFWTRSRTRRDP